MSTHGIRTFSEVQREHVDAAYGRWWESRAAELNDARWWNDITSTKPWRKFPITGLCAELATDAVTVAAGLTNYAQRTGITYTASEPTGVSGGEWMVTVRPREPPRTYEDGY
jgi:hypothetical protein